LRILLLNEDFRRRAGNAARNKVLQQHTLEHQAAELARVYEESLA
jgi:spore maturation protein CgeB